MPQGNPQPGELYLHFKNRKYQVLAVARHTETGETLVVYQALYGTYRVYARPYDMFISEVDHAKYPRVKQTYRFQYLTEEELSEEEPTEAEASGAEIPGGQQTYGKVPKAKSGTGEPEERQPGEPRQLNGPQTGAVLPGQTPDRASGGDITKEEAHSDDGAQEEAADPWLIRFMDTDNLEEKMQVFSEMRPYITDKLIDEIAMVSDLSIPEGELYERYRHLKECLDMRMRFEGSRIRG